MLTGGPVVNVIEPLVLINPKIISKENPIDYYEGLSYWVKGVSTQRYRDIVISTEQEECGWYFSGGLNLYKMFVVSWEEQGKEEEQEKRLLESVCVQHEIDHLNGVTIFDRIVDIHN